MTRTLHVTARFVCFEKTLEQAKAVLKRLTEATRTEAGCLAYEYFQDVEDPTQFLSVERWQSVEAEAAHWETEHLKSALADLDGLMDGAAQVNKYESIEK